MKKKPIYIFNGLNNTGIDNVPNNATVLVLDNGSGFPVIFQKIKHGQTKHQTTIGDFLLDSSLYKFITLNIDHNNNFDENEVLFWSNAAQKWTHRKIAIRDIIDIDLANIADKSILMFDALDNVWKPSLVLDGGTF